jgi:transcriptional regulator with PAS, ATPase and Fis domain
VRKTRLMQRVEQEQGRLLENLLPERINDVGLTDTAQELGISKATLGYWLLKMNIQVKRVALRPGESIEITRQIER